MHRGGLAQVTVTMEDAHRGTIRVGRKRLLDIVTDGGQKLAEYKEKKGEPVTVSADELLNALRKLLAG